MTNPQEVKRRMFLTGTRSKLALAFAVGVSSALFVYFRPNDNTSLTVPVVDPAAFQVNERPRPEVVQAPQAESMLSTKQDKSLGSNAKSWRSSEFFRQFSSAKDLRVFAETAKRSPESGGVHYATEALRECRGHRDLEVPWNYGKLRQELTGARLAAFNWLDGRCKSFTDSELSYVELRSIASSREAALDPIRNLWIQAGKPVTDESQRVSMIADILNSREPSLLTVAFGLATVRLETGAVASAVLVNSVPNAGLDPDSFQLALSLATCKLAGTCNEPNVHTVFRCAYTGRCFPNVAEFVQGQAGSKNLQISAVAEQLRQIIEQGNVAALLPPH